MGKYQLASTPFPPLQNSHGGTGLIKSAKNLVVPETVTRDYRELLGFAFRQYEIRVMSIEISDSATPNWFGVAFRANIQSFDSVNIFFHPSPGGAGMNDSDYQARAGKWPSLFRYAEMFGSQLDVAGSDLIMIIPFFNNASYTTTGLFGPNWEDICNDIVNLARTEALQRSDSQQASIRQVVLSNFSYGRVLMYNFLANSKGVDKYLKEIWDFDGVTGPPPYARGSARGILYDQKSSNDPHAFHLPGGRWINFHHKLINDNHGHIPNMLAWHAAWISFVG